MTINRQGCAGAACFKQGKKSASMVIMSVAEYQLLNAVGGDVKAFKIVQQYLARLSGIKQGAFLGLGIFYQHRHAVFTPKG